MKTYYKINEISKLYSIGQDSLRYYEKLGILHPMRDKNNYRQYTTNDIYRLNMIRDLRNLGFSMEAIREYINHRSIEHSFALMEKEEQIIDQKIKELNAMKKDIQHRKTSLHASLSFPLHEMQLLTLPQRKYVTLKTDTLLDNTEFQLMKLSKEYETHIYTIGNFNTGFFLDIENLDTIHPTSVFILGDSLESYEYILDAGTYLTMYYKGMHDTSYRYLKEMIAYCHQHHYEIEPIVMEFFVIDMHETKNKEEYITQLQIKVKKT
ncbi:MAG: MerR family transcriptional regulator [Longicatena sp.]